MEEPMKYFGGYVTGRENTWNFALYGDKDN